MPIVRIGWRGCYGLLCCHCMAWDNICAVSYVIKDENSVFMDAITTQNEKLNAALLKVEQFLLNRDGKLIDAAMMDNMLKHCERREDAMGYLLCVALGLHLNVPTNQQFLNERLLPSLHFLNPSVFSSIPYYAMMENLKAKENAVELVQKSYMPYQLFPCGDLWLEDNMLRAPLGFFAENYSYPALLQDGREWMTLTPNEIITMQAPLQDLHGDVLVYGLGLGYYTYQALCQPTVRSVTVVDSNLDILHLFSSAILPLWNKQVHEVMPFAEGGRLTLMQDDAFHHAETTGFTCGNGAKATIVFTDLWHDASDGMPMYKRMRSLARPHETTTQFRYWIEPTLQYYMGYGIK